MAIYNLVNGYDKLITGLQVYHGYCLVTRVDKFAINTCDIENKICCTI